MNPGPTGSPGGSNTSPTSSRLMISIATSRGFLPARFASPIAIVPE